METYANVTSVCVRFAKGEEGKRPSLQLKNEQSTAKGEGENWKKLTVRWTGCPGAQLMFLAKKEDGEQRGKLGAYGARMKALTSRWGARRGPAEAEAPED